MQHYCPKVRILKDLNFTRSTNKPPGREAVFLRDRADILRLRLTAVRSKQCANKKNKYYCPEVFLDAVADKLTTTADLFLDAELLSKFTYQVRLVSIDLGWVLLTNVVSSSPEHLTPSSAHSLLNNLSSSLAKTQRSGVTLT